MELKMEQTEGQCLICNSPSVITMSILLKDYCYVEHQYCLNHVPISFEVYKEAEYIPIQQEIDQDIINDLIYGFDQPKGA